MGAATVLMVSGDKIPNNVKAIIADSGYTSVWDIFASEIQSPAKHCASFFREGSINIRYCYLSLALERISTHITNH